MNKITELKLTFDEGISEQELLNKGFEKIVVGKKYEVFELKRNGLTVVYNNKKMRDIPWIELVVHIDEGKVVMYKDAKEFELIYGVNLLKELDFNECEYIEIHGIGDIRQELKTQSFRWNEPDWFKNGMVYGDENNGITYYQEDGFYRISQDDLTGIDTCVLF